MQYIRGFFIGGHLDAGGATKDETGHDNDNEDDSEDDDNEGGGNRALLQGQWNTWGRGAVEGEHRGIMLEGERDVEEEDGMEIGTPMTNNEDNDQALLGIKG